MEGQDFGGLGVAVLLIVGSLSASAAILNVDQALGGGCNQPHMRWKIFFHLTNGLS